MKIETLYVDEVEEHEKNTRSHGEAQLTELVRSIKMFGQIKPIVIDEKNVVLAGHGILQALKKMGEEKVFVNRVSGLTEEQKLKLLAADNKIQEMGYDNYHAINEILMSIKGYDVPGFTIEYVKDIKAQTEKEIEEIISTREENFFNIGGENVPNFVGEREVECPYCQKRFLLGE